MKRALRLAKQAQGWVLPNPMVGAVIVKNDERISDGFHESFGGPHAEINALKKCKDPKGATLYVTLEPCCHSGKTPPCTKAIIESGIKKVVIASLDPSEKVSGKGLAELQAAGIECELGLLEEEAKLINRDFFTFHTLKRPFVTLKVGMSLDAKVSEREGFQTAITGKRTQKMVHLLRHRHHGILVGAGTLLTDNPHLGVRSIEGRDPLRIVFKGKRELPKDLDVFRDGNHLVLEGGDLLQYMDSLYEAGVISVLVEGGPKIFRSFLEAKICDELHAFIAPKILGVQALDAFQNIESISFLTQSVRKSGQDLHYILTPKWDSKPI
jgi:diaminohydroxyphosphoribosylaminopyrimidine deaminase/5-amino-6-(5-phosphoribosylamino)uracil reductase